jgi:hypothetical protein
MIDRHVLHQKAQRYAKSRSINLLSQDHLGLGTDGVVWQTDRETVVKVLERALTYERERDCYRRFHDKDVMEIAGFAVPRMVDCDDDLLVIEMTYVDPPRILDFGKVLIDEDPPYHDDERVLGNARAKAMSDFGDEWSSVAILLHTLRKEHGIYYADPSINNIVKSHRPPSDSDSGCSPSPMWDMDIYDDPE